MRSADLLFLPLHDTTPGCRAVVVPGKTYEYMASGRPILAAVPAGDARDLLLRAGCASLCAPRGVEEMKRVVQEAVEGRIETTPVPPSVLARYERRNLVAQTAAVLAEALGSAEPVDVTRTSATAALHASAEV
jgi:glycosyltransferase involved in cell wall biosynthesis